MKKLNFSIKKTMIIDRVDAEERKKGHKPKKFLMKTTALICISLSIVAPMLALTHALIDAPQLLPYIHTLFLTLIGFSILVMVMRYYSFEFEPCTESQYVILTRQKAENEIVERYIDAVRGSGRDWMSNVEFYEIGSFIAESEYKKSERERNINFEQTKKQLFEKQT